MSSLGKISMSVVPLKGLGPEEQEVQARCIALLKEKSEALVAEYRARFGTAVGTDLAREMFPDYAASLDSKLRFAGATQRPAAALADLVYERIVSDLSGGIALFTGGGTGAGKTTSIFYDGQIRTLFREASVIFDGNFNSLKSSKGKIDLALDKGCQVVVVFVHRHPVAAYMKGVIPRALEQGRTVPIDGHLRMHKDAIRTFLKAYRYYADNQNVSFVVLNNTGHEQESFRADVDYLRDVKYDSDAIESAIRKGLENELKEQRISQALYEASCATSSSPISEPVSSGSACVGS
jgi:hypothetical protein